MIKQPEIYLNLNGSHVIAISAMDFDDFKKVCDALNASFNVLEFKEGFDNLFCVMEGSKSIHHLKMLELLEKNIGVSIGEGWADFEFSIIEKEKEEKEIASFY